MARTEKNSLNTKKILTLQEEYSPISRTHNASRFLRLFSTLLLDSRELFFGYLRPKVQLRLIVPKHYTSISLKRSALLPRGIFSTKQ